MKYHEDEFFRLMTEVEKQGGVYLDEVHENVYHPRLTGTKVSDGVAPRFQLVYCNANALFDVPYMAPDDDGKQPSIKVCAVDDCMGLWPRFREANAPGYDHSYPLGAPK